MAQPGFAVVVGTSAGGLSALSEFVSQLRPGMNAAVFIVMHLSRTSINDLLIQRLQPRTLLMCEIAKDHMEVKAGHIYIAAPNFHLLVKDGFIILGSGPTENRWRPSIDVLFRSAAVSYNSRAIGVILTGLLDDGTNGMQAIRRSGGITIVQDPGEAEYPDMPMSVLGNMEVNYRLRLAAMGEVIEKIVAAKPAATPVPGDIMLESEIAERVVVNYDNLRQIAHQSIYACPDCGGGLWYVNEEPGNKTEGSRYRCHIGHSYSERDLVLKQAEMFEATLWTALRIMEERRNLLRKIEDEYAVKGSNALASNYREKVETIQVHIDTMKEILATSQKMK